MILLSLVVVVLVVVVVRLQHALEHVREELANVRLLTKTSWPTAELGDLQRRVVALEAALSNASVSQAAAPPVETPTVVGEAIEQRAVEKVEAVVAQETPTIDEEEALVDARAGVPDLAAPHVVEQPLPSPVLLPVPSLASAPQPAAASMPAAPQEGWEVVVGTSWLNKIGVVVFVVGLALLLGYSMANVGPLGRVAMGYALSLGMLGTGVVLERRETYRNYAYGLMGGGWAGVYFTTYAMHALPAALVVESELVASVSLVAVAAGMIVHSLRYRSQTLTGLAYVSAYAPLAFSPLSTFSLAATVPLTASLLVVATRFTWLGVTMLGLASTYGIFILRTPVFDAVATTASLQFVLWSYWLLFEVADIVARRRVTGTTEPAPIFALNAAGFLGAILLLTQGSDQQWLSIGAAASAYAVSALVRTRLTGHREVATESAALGFTTVHGATAVAAALFAYAIELRFSDAPQTLALLVETQLLIGAGIALADRQVRRIGTALAVLTTLHLGWVLLNTVPASGFQSVLGASPIALLVAAVWYGNREWLRRRELALDAPERLYGWAALLVLLHVLAGEVPGAYRGPAAMCWAMLLLEAGLRRAREYRYQSYVAVAAAATMSGVAFVVDPVLDNRAAGFDRDVWIALPITITLAYGFAARAGQRAAAVASSIATTLLAVFEVHVVPASALAAAWAGTAAAVTTFGAWRGGAAFRWQGYAFAAVASLLPLANIALAEAPVRISDAVGARQISTVLSIVFLYLVSYVGRSAAPAAARLEPIAAGYVAFLGNVLQALFVWRFVPRVAVAPIWAASAAVLVTLGARRRRPWQRWQGYGLIALATLQAAAIVAMPPDSTGQILAGACVIALTYLVGYLSRRLQTGATPGSTEGVAAGLLSFVASAHLAYLIHEFLPASRTAAAWTTAAIALTALGVWRERVGQRWQGYGFFSLSLAWMILELATDSARDTRATLWMAFSVLAIYGAALAIRSTIRSATPNDSVPPEEMARVGLLVAATVTLSALLMDEAGTRLATLAWALQGAALLVVGFLARERVLRLSGLALLFVCILKLFAYDLQQLEALARIMSFVVLGLVLLAVSWVYTRYREQIRKLL